MASRPQVMHFNSSSPFAIPVDPICSFTVPVSGQLIEARVYSTVEPVGGDAEFEVLLDSSPEFTFNLLEGDNLGEIVAQTLAVIKGQVVSVRLNDTPSSIGETLVVEIVIAESGAVASDAQLRDRATHTGTQLATTISNFTAAVLAAGHYKQFTYVVSGGDVDLLTSGGDAVFDIVGLE